MDYVAVPASVVVFCCYGCCFAAGAVVVDGVVAVVIDLLRVLLLLLVVAAGVERANKEGRIESMLLSCSPCGLGSALDLQLPRCLAAKRNEHPEAVHAII